MSKKDIIIDKAKTVLILILLVFAIFLLRQTEYYSTAFEYISGIFISTRDSIQSSDSDVQSTEPGTKVTPVAVSVSFGQGNRCASIYDKSAVEADFQRFSAILGEALGSSGEPSQISRDKWLAALAEEGVYIRLFAPQQLSVLSKALGTSMSSSAAAERSDSFCLSCSDNLVRIYYVGSDGYFYCDTNVSPETLRSRLSEFVPDNSRFSHEISTLSGLKSTMIIPDSSPAVFSVLPGGSISQSEIKELLTAAFDMNEYTASEYNEADGTLIFIDGGNTIRISTGAEAEFIADRDKTPAYVALTNEAAHDMCWRIMNAGVLKVSGSADVFSWYEEGDEPGSIRIFFDYSVNGIPLSLQDGAHAAVFEFEKGVLMNACIQFKSYLIGEESFNILPALQAAAIASAAGNNSIELVYSEFTDGISCVWVPR